MKLQDLQITSKRILPFFFCHEQYVCEITAAISLMTLAMHETCIRSQE